MSVDLRRLQARMSQQFLHDTQVGTPVEEVGGKAVAQCVRVGRHRRPAVQDAPDVTRTEAVATTVVEERPRVATLARHGRSRPAQPSADGVDASIVRQDLALLGAFPGHRHHAVV